MLQAIQRSPRASTKRRNIGKNGRLQLKAIRPSAALEKQYQATLDAWIEKMNASVAYWLRAAFKANEPEIAQDALPANELQAAMKKLSRRWLRNFSKLSDQMADHFAEEVMNRSDNAMKQMLRDNGFSVPFTMTRPMQDVFRSTVNANVSLIKSIPAKYLTEVEGMVMRSVQEGGDLKSLTSGLMKQYGVTKRRAALIARDQNNKANAAFQKVRQKELGIKKAVWVHSHAGKHPRPSHLKMDGKEYDIEKGMWDPDVQKYIQPGELINCRCFSRSFIEGFS